MVWRGLPPPYPHFRAMKDGLGKKGKKRREARASLRLGLNILWRTA